MSYVIYWVKANIDCLMVGTNTSCGAIFCDYSANFLGGFSSNLRYSSVLHTESMTIIIAIEALDNKGWNSIWIESDSQVAIRAFMNKDILP